MKYILTVCSLIISIGLVSCSGKKPEYIPRSNTYTFNFLNRQNGNLIAESLVYTFNTESMENQYYKSFCADVKDCSTNINNIKNSPLFGGFNLSKKPIINNNLGIKNVDLYRLSYTTTGQNHEIRTVSGAVFMPDTDTPKGVILYFHPTFFARTSTPSFGITSNTQDNTIASVFAANGYIVIAPDYIGLGIDKTVPHPFVLYPLVNANDGLSMLIATKNFFKQKSLSSDLPLFVTGFSEGSAYALWFSRLYQEQAEFKEALDDTQFKLTLIAPMSGAYNLSNVVYNYLFADISILNKDKYNAYSSIIASKLKPSLLAFALVGYAYYNQNSDYNKVFQHSFFTMQCTWQKQDKCNYENNNYNLARLFDQEKDVEILAKIVNAASFKYFDMSLFTAQTNNVMPLINPAIVKNPDSDFIHTLLSADIYYWHSEFPTTLIYLAKDSVVSPDNTEFAYRGMLDSRSTNLKKISMDNALIKVNASSYLPNFDVDHVIALPYLSLIALKEFNAALVQLTTNQHETESIEIAN